MSTVLLILILLGVAGAGFYFYSRSRAAEGDQSLVPQGSGMRKLESERRDNRPLDRLQIDDVLVFEGEDYAVRGMVTYRAKDRDDSMEPRAVEYLLQRVALEEADGDTDATADVQANLESPEDAEDRWLWVEARGEVSLQVRGAIDADELDADFNVEIPRGEDPNIANAPDSVRWAGDSYSLQDAETVDRTARGHTPGRATGEVTYFHYASADGDVLYVERIASETHAFAGRKVAEYELEVL